jgi:uncharacterized protein DUF3551
MQTGCRRQLNGDLTRRPKMRSTILSLLLAAAALAGAAPAAHAQSPYDYPWCAIYADKSGAQSCYYATYRQCAETLSGIGGFCIRSPYFRER